MQPRTWIVATFFLAGIASFALSSSNKAAFDNTPQSPRDFSDLVQKAEQGDRDAQFRLELLTHQEWGSHKIILRPCAGITKLPNMATRGQKTISAPCTQQVWVYRKATRKQ